MVYLEENPSNNSSSNSDCGKSSTSSSPPSTPTSDKVKPKGQPLKMDPKSSMTSNLKSGVDTAAGFLTKGPALRQLAVGAVTGWTSGFMTIRAGKPIALTVGGGILIYQLAFSQGLVKDDWKNLKSKLDQKAGTLKTKANAPKMLARAQTFARGNTVFAAGFIGGFLIGLAS